MSEITRNRAKEKLWGIWQFRNLGEGGVVSYEDEVGIQFKGQMEKEFQSDAKNNNSKWATK